MSRYRFFVIFPDDPISIMTDQDNHALRMAGEQYDILPTTICELYPGVLNRIDTMIDHPFDHGAM